MTALLLLAAAYLGWNLGANDSANCIGPAVGSGLISYRRAILLVILAAAAGALLEGGRVIGTVGQGIVSAPLPPVALFIAMLSAGLAVTLPVVLLKLPVSTSQAIVGAMTGIGLAVGLPVHFSLVLDIIAVWVFSPLLALILSQLIYYFVALPLRLLHRVSLWDHLLNYTVIISAGYASYSWGANNIGNAIGPLANLGYHSDWIILLGVAAVALGAVTYAGGVTETVAGGITQLDPLSAFATQTSVALVTHLFAVVGIPVSLSQLNVGALVGIGLVKGVRAVSRAKVFMITLGWVLTPTAAGLLAFVLYKLIGRLIG
ncbi:MAG TPA: inorganic phosphate transporter [Candidatus Fraserbacteria bacterium]|mgnify:CR=1 FL=1|nr:inorganic phosphate transporter [Candidatus Fraserbacteria bacterium]